MHRSGSTSEASTSIAIVKKYYPPIAFLSRAGRCRAMGEDDEGTDDEGPIEVFGIHRLELKPGSKSGYVGVRPNPSKTRPWQAWLQDGGRRKTVGNR